MGSITTYSVNIFNNSENDNNIPKSIWKGWEVDTNSIKKVSKNTSPQYLGPFVKLHNIFRIIFTDVSDKSIDINNREEYQFDIVYASYLESLEKRYDFIILLSGSKAEPQTIYKIEYYDDLSDNESAMANSFTRYINQIIYYIKNNTLDNRKEVIKDKDYLRDILQTYMLRIVFGNGLEKPIYPLYYNELNLNDSNIYYRKKYYNDIYPKVLTVLKALDYNSNKLGLDDRSSYVKQLEKIVYTKGISYADLLR